MRTHRHHHTVPVVKVNIEPQWVSYTEMAKFTEDHYDYILARVHDSMAHTAMLPGGFPGLDAAIEAMELSKKNNKKPCPFQGKQ